MVGHRHVPKVLWLVPLLAGCFQASTPSSAVSSVRTKHPDSAKYVLDREPEGARNVIQLRQEAQDGEEIVIIGRIGGSKTPLIRGRAAFSIVDLSLKPCADDPNCYDFACLGKEKVARASALVKFVDAQQETLKIDTRDLVGIDRLEARVVVVRGQARRDEAGNLVVLARQLYLRPLEPTSVLENDQP